MKEKLRYWWYRVWTYRKDKFELVFHEPCTLGEIYIYGSDNRYIMYIGKGYFVVCSYAEINMG